MEVKLIVAKGKKAGLKIPVKGPKFFIGRAEDCQLRPHSDLVSRHHCVIFVEESFVGVRDFGSKNGTFVNDQGVRGEQELKTGDLLRVGDLEFSVELEIGVGGKKKPKVKSVQEAAARTVETSADDDLDLDSWLNETQTVDSTRVENPAESETQTVVSSQAELQTVDDRSSEDTQGKDDSSQVPGTFKGSRWNPAAATPRDAAADALKNLFGRR